MSYADFLSKLLALGAKLPLLWPIILHVIDDFQQAWQIINGPPKLMGAESGQSFSAAETDAEAQVAAIFDQHEPKTFGAIGDGSIIDMLRTAFAFLRASPILMEIVRLFLDSLLKSPALKTA